MNILFLSYEVAPIYKFGGLGDVANSLPKALRLLGVDITIGMPGYGHISHPRQLPGTDIPMLYVEDDFYKLPGIIGIHKIPKHRAIAFALFAKRLVEILEKQPFIPDIIHLNDWHTGLVAYWLQKQKNPRMARIKTVLTIHNTHYQGIFPVRDISAEPKTGDIGKALALRSHGRVNFLRRSIKAADWVTTVSKSYAEEIRNHQFGFGVGEQIRAKKDTFVGILNGIDYDLWNSTRDKLIYRQYSQTTVSSGKQANKTYLQKKLHLPVNSTLPLFVMVARLVPQKGFGLLLPVLASILKRTKLQVVFLGEGDERIAHSLSTLVKRFSTCVAFVSRFDETLAHQVYAGADFFLAPSEFEPCGLTQMISMRYGTIPITAAVGGLKDTVQDNKTGFVFSTHNQPALRKAIDRALVLWQYQPQLELMRQEVMRQEFSNTLSARHYLALYKKMIG